MLPPAPTPARTRVMKLGGRALEASGALPAFARALAQLRSGRAEPSSTIVVHGGGAEVSEWSMRAGLMPRFADGLRVTDAPTLEIAAAVLAGLANKRLVAALRAAGLDAVGLSLVDGIARVRRHPDAGRLGEVGEIAAIDRSLLDVLLAAGRLPVLASLGDDGQGALLNLNADDAAAAIAAALPAEELVLLSDAPGVVLAGAIVPTLDAGALDRLLEHSDVTGGMRPKLRAARSALQAGVRRVHIAAWSGAQTLASLLAGEAIGTTITNEEATVRHG